MPLPHSVFELLRLLVWSESSPLVLNSFPLIVHDYGFAQRVAPGGIRTA
jgi:hypothetical protein